MPTVFLTRYECDRALLPPICARCGVPADQGVRIRVPTPASHIVMSFLLVVCPPLFLVLAAVNRIERNARIPLCEPDRADWQWRDRVTSWTYLILVAGTYLAAPILAFAVLPVRDEMACVLGFLAYYVVFVAWVTPAAVMWTRTVRSSKVTRRGIRLSGVHPAFVAALNDDRARDRDPARHAWFGDERDDFDDEPNG